MDTPLVSTVSITCGPYPSLQSTFSVRHSKSAPISKEDGGNHGDDSDDEDMMEDILIEDAAGDNEEGSPLETDEQEVVDGLVKLTLPKATVELVQILYFRLDDIVANIADYPPAHHYVK